MNTNLILENLDELLSDNIVEHCKTVSRKALQLSSNFDNVDVDLVEEGALLHDIGRSKTHSIFHGVVGAEILRKREFPIEVQRIAERHIGAGIPQLEAEALGLPAKDYIPITLEEKIVAHADNLVHGTEEVGINFVIKKWEKRLGSDHPSIPRILKLHEEIVGSSDFENYY
ncbi:TIGR00295 family protein [Methanobacterium aggregans]|uniref:TIGR00295 family protein n=1 Tax=Methanobacterium aggregans TaxID=1615586 RepID=UPI001AE39E93|nr:TIGR00295 family protein [Methanobacterium aggregans]MBP2045581.1 uncharacterized protein [Methanobacterium aggregans]